MSETATPVASAAQVSICLTLYMSPPPLRHLRSADWTRSFLRSDLHLRFASGDERGQPREDRVERVRRIRVMPVAGRDADRDRYRPERTETVEDDAGDRERAVRSRPRHVTSVGRSSVPVTTVGTGVVARAARGR